MIYFYLNHIDQIVLTLCLVFTFINTIRLVQRATIPVRKIPAWFVVFGATSVATFLGAEHLFKVSYQAIEQAIDGTFVYTYQFYSLILIGVVLLVLSIRMLNEIGNLFQGKSDSQSRIIFTALLIVAISDPTGLFTPIGYVPSMACTILLIALPFSVKQSAMPAIIRTETISTTHK